MPKTRKCSKCHKVKALTKFKGPNKQCRDCVRAYQRDYHAKRHKEGGSGAYKPKEDYVRWMNAVVRLHPDYVFPDNGCRKSPPVIAGKRVCTVCAIEYPLDQFGRTLICKTCLRKRKEPELRSKGVRTREYKQEQLDEQLKRGTKVCFSKGLPCCGKELPLGDFSRKQGTWDGLMPICKQCWTVYQMQRYYAASPEERLKRNVRARLSQEFRLLPDADKRCVHVSGSKMFGCTLPELSMHIRGLWWPGMSWDNWGNWDTRVSGDNEPWHIDHIWPAHCFDLATEMGQSAWCNWRNLQPLWRPLNISKSNSTDWTPKGKILTLRKNDGTTLLSEAPVQVYDAVRSVTPDILLRCVQDEHEECYHSSEGRDGETAIAVA
jgi:hypothetical protein